MDDWIHEYYQRYGREIQEKGLGRRTVLKLTGLSERKARRLVAYVRDNPFWEEDESDLPLEADSTDELLFGEDTEEVKWVHDTRYYYAKDSDTYVTFLSRSKQPLVVPGQSHREMKRRYSNWDGKPASINTICREFSIPRSWFSEYKSIHGWTHDSEPFSDEEMMQRSEADLVSDAL